MTDQLGKIARLCELQLEGARVQHASAERELARRRDAAARIRSLIDESHAVAQRLVSSDRGTSAAMLLQLRAYQAWQHRNLKEQQTRVQESETLAQNAHREVLERFRRLSTIERLQERRAREAATEHAYRDQKSLDAHALIRSATCE